MERAFAGDEAEALRMALCRVKLARRLDRPLECFRARVGEEDIVGKARIHETRGQPLRFGDAEEVGDMPQLPALGDQRLNQVRMAVAKAADRDAGAEIEIALAIGCFEPAAFAARESHIGTCVGRQ